MELQKVVSAQAEPSSWMVSENLSLKPLISTDHSLGFWPQDEARELAASHPRTHFPRDG